MTQDFVKLLTTARMMAPPFLRGTYDGPACVGRPGSLAAHSSIKWSSTWYVLLLLVGIGASCSHAPPEPASPSPTTDGGAAVTLALNWFPDAQHGGFFAAEEFDYFREERLNVTLQPGGPAAPVLQSLALKKVEFGVANADQVLLARSEGMPVVAVFAAMQNSPRCLMFHRQSGISAWDNVRDVTLALGAGQAFAAYLQQRLPLPQVKIVPYNGSIAPFLTDKRFAQQGYIFSEPFFARQQGADPVTLMVSDLGFNPYVSCVVTHEEIIRDRPEMVQRFVNAVYRGWTEYRRRPDEVNQRIHKVNSQADLASLTFGAQTLADLCQPPGTPPDAMGRMTLERWTSLESQLISLKLCRSSAADQAFTNQFLPGSSAQSERTGDLAPARENDKERIEDERR